MLLNLYLKISTFSSLIFFSSNLVNSKIYLYTEMHLKESSIVSQIKKNQVEEDAVLNDLQQSKNHRKHRKYAVVIHYLKNVYQIRGKMGVGWQLKNGTNKEMMDYDEIVQVYQPL